MTKIQCTYKGGGLAVLRHGPTGSEITTDLPPDNGGKGRGFSATDLLASSLASCILTIMARRDEIGDLAKSIEQINKNVGNLVLEVRGAADQLVAATDQIASASQQISDGAQQQSSAFEELSSSVQSNAMKVLLPLYKGRQEVNE